MAQTQREVCVDQPVKGVGFEFKWVFSASMCFYSPI